MKRTLLIAGPPLAIILAFAALAPEDFNSWGWVVCLVVGSLMTVAARFALGPKP
ncbi:hypothetical protein OPU71_18470 [Niveibacterium sp. 24ML]|uniref:hypothetical protein n=1 Tax=Niveibacterium sp. 24ML TaxID=2985512 RepID=UPI00227016FA|nr:hypothetical protein [Niveibacterium sp. 24ML]MCX9158111.1 hypothetical protein [Niveibacterium sp. 24ML]